nr:uncharacterized protein LOC123750026 [Procambarus clarkii]XP_045588119.1 uncharacterized protein LOC123750026 [Procambarus clarkii]
MASRLLVGFLLTLAWITFASTKRSGRPGAEVSPDVADLGSSTVRPAENIGLNDVGLLSSMWQAVQPYVLRKETSDLEARLTAFKRQLLTKADDLVNLRTRIPDSRLLAGGRWSRRRKVEEVVKVVSAGVGSVEDKVITPTGSSSEHHRSKRDHLEGFTSLRDTEGVPVLAAVEGAVRLGAPGAGAVHMTVWRGKLIVAIIDNAMNVSLYTVDQRTWQATYALTIPGKSSCDFTVVPGDVLLLACIVPFAPSKRTAFREDIHEAVMIYEVTDGISGNIALKFWQKIQAEHSLDLIMWIQGGKNYLLVADSKEVIERLISTPTGTKRVNKTNYHTVSRLYHWTGQYFDVLQELPGTNPRGLLHFLVGNTHFIAVANFRNNKGQHNCYSMIYRYSPDAGHYVLFQEVFTKGAFNFESFTLGTTRHNDTFLAVANYCQDDQNGRCNPDTSSTIYRYHYGKFVAFQEIRTSNAVQWLAIQVEDTVLLAVANAVAGVKFFQYNGWRFEPTAVQYFAGPFGPGVTRMATITWNNAILIAVTNRDPQKTGGDKPTLYAITFSRDKSLQEFRKNSQKWCRERLLELTRQDVTSLLKRVKAAPKTTYGYTFTQPVALHGHLRVLLASHATKVYSRSTEVWKPPSWEYLTEVSERLQLQVAELRARFRNVVIHKGPVTWPAGLHLTRVEGSQVSAESSVSSLQSAWVNGQSVIYDHLVRLNMRNSINRDMFTFEHVLSRGATWVEKLLMGRAMSTYVTLSGRHVVSGDVTFRGRLAASFLVSLATVDGVRVARDVLFTTNIHSYAGIVTCGDMAAKDVRVTTINTINIDQLFSSLLRRDVSHTTSAVTGHVVVEGDLVYHRDLEANITASIILDNLLRLDRFENQVVTGDHRVGGMRCLSARVTGRVNGVRVPGEVFQRHYHLPYSVSSAAFTHLLAASLTINTALHTITVSNKNLDLLRVVGALQVVTSRKTFSSMRLLQEVTSEGSYTYKRKRREADSRLQACTTQHDWELTEGEARLQVLLGALRILTSSQDLMTSDDFHPAGGGAFNRQNIAFYIRLAQEPSYASLYTAASDLLLCDVLLDNMFQGERQNDELFNRANITHYRADIEKVITDAKTRLAEQDVNMHDVFLMFISSRRLAERRDLETLDLLIYALDDSRTRASNSDYNICRFVCPQKLSINKTDRREISTCDPSIYAIYNTLKRIIRYGSVLETTMARLSDQQVVLLQKAAVDHELGKLLEIIQERRELWEGLQVAALCSAPPGNREERLQLLQMLASYRQQLARTTAVSLKRTRRDVLLTDSDAASGTNSPSSSASVNDSYLAINSTLGAAPTSLKTVSLPLNITPQAGVALGAGVNIIYLKTVKYGENNTVNTNLSSEARTFISPSSFLNTDPGNLGDEGHRLRLIDNSSVGILGPRGSCPGCPSEAASNSTRSLNPSKDLPIASPRVASEVLDDVLHISQRTSSSTGVSSRDILTTEAPPDINTSVKTGLPVTSTVATVFNPSRLSDVVRVPYQENSTSFSLGDYCRNISSHNLEDFDSAIKIIDEVKIFRQYLHIVASTHPWDLSGPSVDQRLDAEIFSIFGIVAETVEHFVHDPLQPLGSRNATSLIKEALLFDAAMDFAALSQYKFSNAVTSIIEHLEHLILNATELIENILACYDSSNFRNESTVASEILLRSLPAALPYPEVTSLNIDKFIAVLTGNKALLLRIDFLLTFVNEILSVNPWKRPNDQPVFSVNHSFVVATAKKVRNVLYLILADDSKYFSEFDSLVLSLLLTDYKVAMGMVQGLLPDHLPADTETIIRQIYGPNELNTADQARNILYGRRRFLEKANDDISKLIASFTRHANDSSSGVDKSLPGAKETNLGSWVKLSKSWRSFVSVSWVSGRVAGYRLENIARQHDVVHDKRRIMDLIGSSTRVRNLVLRARLSVSVVNGVEMSRVIHHALTLSATVLTIPLTFSAATEVGELQAGYVNNMPAGSYLTLGGDHHLPRPLVFTESVVVRGQVVVSSTVNNLDLVDLGKSVVLTSGPPQVILTSVTFLNLSAVSVGCEVARLTGVLLRHLLTRAETAVITGKKRFLEEVIVRKGDVKTASFKVDLVTGVNITHLVTDSLRRSPGGVQVVSSSLQGTFLVVQQQLVSRGFTVSSQGVDGYLDLHRLASQVVFRNQDTTINARLKFVGHSSISTLFFQDTFDLVSAEQYSAGWLLKTTDQSLEGQVTVPSMTSSRVTTALGVKIQEVDFTRFHKFAALITQSVTLSFVRFREVRSMLWVNLTGHIQGWDLSQDAILTTTTSNLVFTSSMTFLGPVNVTGDFVATKGINDGSLATLCGQVSLDTLTITGTVTYLTRLNVNVVVLGIHEITDETVPDFWMNDRDVNFEKPLTLKRLTTRHVTTVKSNAAQLVAVKERMLPRLCSSGTETVVLRETFTFIHLTVVSLHTQTLQILTMNDVPLTELQQVLTTEGNQVITGHYTLNNVLFMENLITADTVNGKMMTRFCQQTTPCLVTAAKTFIKNVTVSKALSILDNRTVQGVDVSVAFSSWVNRFSCGHIPGLTTFSGTHALHLPNIVVHGLVDSVQVAKGRLMSLSENQVMIGALTINTQSGGRVRSEAFVATDGFFNTLNLTHLANSTFRLDRNVSVASPVHFTQLVIFLDASYLVTRVNLTEVSIGKMFDLQPLLFAFTNVRGLSEHLSVFVKAQVREYWGWRSVQRFEEIPERIVPLWLPWGKASAGPVDGVAPVLASNYLVVVTKANYTSVLVYETASHRYRSAGMSFEGNCTSEVVGFTSHSGQQKLAMGHLCQQDDQGLPSDVFTSFNASTQQGRVEGDELLRLWHLTPNEAIVENVNTTVPGIADMQVVVLGETVCLVVVEGRSSDTVLLCEGPSGFTVHQRISTTNPVEVSVAKHRYPDGRVVTIMAVADPGLSSRDAGSVFIYAYDDNFGEFYLVQEERLENVVWVELASYDTDLLLAALSEDVHGDLGSKVAVYRLDWTVREGVTLMGYLGSAVKTPNPTTNPNFFLVQELPVSLPVEARFSVLPLGQLCLYVINRDGLITWFCHKGIHRFRKEGELHMPGKLTLEAWMSFDGEKFVHRISVAGQSCSHSRQTIPRLPGEVLEMRIRG